MKILSSLLSFFICLGITSHLYAQSLFERPANAQPGPSSQPAANPPTPPNSSTPPTQSPSPASAQPAPTDQSGADDPNAPARAAAAQLEGYSLMVVLPPKPPTYHVHDKIHVIINETSQLKFEETTDTKKSYDLSAALKKFPSLRHLLEFQLEQGDTSPLLEAAANASSGFNGDGSVERKNNFTARIAAEVIDVKPNGDLVLEAQKTISKDGETTSIVLSGVCSQADITTSRTIQSSQIANLILKTENSGTVRDASKKGILSQIFDAIFNF